MAPLPAHGSHHGLKAFLRSQRTSALSNLRATYTLRGVRSLPPSSFAAAAGKLV